MEVRTYCKNFEFKLPEDWTWKQVFIWLFNIKRQSISVMYNNMRIPYQYSYKPLIANSLCYIGFSDGIVDTPEERFANREICFHVPIIDNEKGDITLTPVVDLACFGTMGEIQDMNLYHQAKLICHFDYGNQTYDIKDRERRHKNRPANKKILLKEGICVWNCKRESYIPIFSYQGFVFLFEEYEKIVSTLHEKRLNTAIKLIYEISKNFDKDLEEFYETITCDFLERALKVIEIDYHFDYRGEIGILILYLERVEGWNYGYGNCTIPKILDITIDSTRHLTNDSNFNVNFTLIRQRGLVECEHVNNY
jgi:hypothetical protein